MPARSRAARCLVVVALLAVSGLIPVTAAAAPDGTPAVRSAVGGATTDTTAASSGNTTITIDIQPDGDAEWTITMTQTVSNGSAAADLDELVREYEDGDTPYLSTTPFRTAAESVGDAVDREMEITEIRRSGQADNGTVRLTASFTWSNFAESNDEEVAVRDVFSGPTGRWFGAGADGGPGLTSDQRLVIVPPEEYDISSVSRDASLQNGTIRWQGPVGFDGDSPYAVFTRDVPNPPTQTLTSPVNSVTTDPGNGDESNALLLPLIILFIGALAAVAYVVTRTDVPIGSPSDGTVTDDPATDAAATTASDTRDDTSDATATNGASGGSPAQPGPAAGTEEDVDEELLSDEERVERLLERNGGRMKQANIVTETGWSNAKVSQLLSSMAEEGRIEKLRIGRENLISFPDADFTDDSDGE